MRVLGKLPERCYLATLDVSSLYTNIDTDEGLTIVEEELEKTKISNRCTSRRMRVSNIGAMCQFDQSEERFSVCFDELEHYFIENGQKQHT